MSFMKRKTVHISLPETDYFKLQEHAKREHLRLSTWIRQMLLKIANNATGKGN
jgi:hypothetical protein